MGTGASRTVHALRSHQKARISFDLHGCVTWKRMPLTALEPLDRSWQPARSVELDDLRLQVDRVEHRSLHLAGCSLHNLGSGQQAAAGARWRGGAARIGSAIRLSCSERATMWRGPRLPHTRNTATTTRSRSRCSFMAMTFAPVPRLCTRSTSTAERPRELGLRAQRCHLRRRDH